MTSMLVPSGVNVPFRCGFVQDATVSDEEERMWFHGPRRSCVTATVGLLSSLQALPVASTTSPWVRTLLRFDPPGVLWQDRCEMQVVLSARCYRKEPGSRGPLTERAC